MPTTWGAGYIKLSKPVPHCASHRTVTLASELAARLIEPALAGDVDGKAWSPDKLRWV